MSGYPLRLFFAFLLLAGFYACRKKENASATTSSSAGTHTDSILYNGCDYVGEEMLFQIDWNLTTFKDFVWDFGDGSTSHEFVGNHTYGAPGTYTVSFSMNGKTTKRTIVVLKDLKTSAHTAAMAGTKRWKGTGYGDVGEFPDLYDGPIDTLLTLQVINAGTVKLPFVPYGVILKLDIEDTVNKMLTFKNCSVTGISLKYFYELDSMVYTNHWSQGHSGENLVIHNP